MQYVNQGYVKRIDNGRFVFTDLGRKVFGIAKASGSQEPEASNPSHGGGKVRAPDFPPAQPEGASPSTSTAQGKPPWDNDDDEIPF